MRVLVIAGWLSRRPWGEGRFAADLVGALADLGHEVHLAADSIEDPGQFDRAVGISSFRPFRDNAVRTVAGFRRFAADRARAIPHDATISLSRLVPASVWMPVDFGPGAWTRHSRRVSGAMRLVMKIPRHWRLPAALTAEARASSAYFPTGTIQRLLVFGPEAAADAARSFPDLAGRIVDVGMVSRLPATTPGELDALRAAARAALGIDPARRVLLVSLPWSIAPDDPELAAFFAGASRTGHDGPLILCLCRDAMSVHRAAVRHDWNTDHGLRILGRTERIQSALAAADAVGIPITASGGAFRSGAMGRLAADALRFGRPVLAIRGGTGAELVAGQSQGWIVDKPTPEAWSAALRLAGDGAWLQPASAAAREAGRELGFDRLAGRVDAALRYIASPGAPAPGTASALENPSFVQPVGAP